MTDDKLTKLLNYDSLSEAEKLTGEDYHDSKLTTGLGFLLLQENERVKREALTANNDLHRRIGFLEAVDVVLDLGFELVYAQILPDPRRDNPVHFQVYWRKGILLTLESYGKDGPGEYERFGINQAHIWYNYRNADGGTNFRPEISGSSSWTRETAGWDGEYPEDPWTMLGDKQVTEGLRHYLDILDATGGVLEEWAYTPRTMQIHSYAERTDEDNSYKGDWFVKYDAKNVERINQFAEPVRSMILAGRRGRSWDR